MRTRTTRTRTTRTRTTRTGTTRMRSTKMRTTRMGTTKSFVGNQVRSSRSTNFASLYRSMPASCTTRIGSHGGCHERPADLPRVVNASFRPCSCRPRLWPTGARSNRATCRKPGRRGRATDRHGGAQGNRELHDGRRRGGCGRSPCDQMARGALGGPRALTAKRGGRDGRR